MAAQPAAIVIMVIRFTSLVAAGAFTKRGHVWAWLWVGVFEVWPLFFARR